MPASFCPTRRRILYSSALLLAPDLLLAADTPPSEPATLPSTEPADPIIDIHQHTNYSGRTDEHLLHHQRAMGATKTILLPAGSEVNRPSTHDGKTNGLAAK